MAYDEYQADRIRNVLKEKNVAFEEKKMFAGICFMVDDKMCVGTHIDKNDGHSLLLVRIGEDLYNEHQHRKGFAPMNFTGRPMKGFAFITPEGTDTEEELSFWIDQALAYNPLAKKSKKRAKKKS